MASDRLIEDWRVVAGRADEVLLEGFHAVKHAMRFDATIDLVISVDLPSVLELADSHAPDIRARLEAEARVVDRATFVSLVGRMHPTGCAALAKKPDVQAQSLLEPAARLTPAVYLENPRNLGNVGAVIRVAAGMAASAMFSSGEVDPWHPNVLRGSAGLHFAVPVLRISGAADLKGPIYAFDAAGEDLRQIRFPDDAVLAFGSERQGISRELRQHADQLVSIPMRAQVSSYNLTTSVAMALYHWTLWHPTDASSC